MGCRERARPGTATRDLRLFRRHWHATGIPTGDPPSLADQHVVALDDDGRILMATRSPRPRRRSGRLRRPHLVGQLRRGTRSGSSPRWRSKTRITAQGITLARRSPDALFHVLVPARHWWDDIGFT